MVILMHVPIAPAACDLTRPGAASVPAGRGSPPRAPGLGARVRGQNGLWTAVPGRATPPGSDSSPGARHAPAADGWHAASASPPTLSSHKVATATANHRRAARAGWVMWVCCPCQPARLVLLQPCAIQARTPYQQAVLASSGRSVRLNHGSVYPASQ